MKLKLLIAVAAMSICSGAWASDVTYKCVVDHSLGVKMAEMRPVRFKTDYEYRIEPVASYLEKTEGGDPGGYDMKEGEAYTYAVRRTDKDPSDFRNWEVMEDRGVALEIDDYDFHIGRGIGVDYYFNADEGRMAVINWSGAELWAHGYDPVPDTTNQFTKCAAHYD